MNEFTMDDSVGDVPNRLYSSPQYYKDEIVEGIVLQNYVKRESIEDNHYVLVTHHAEHLEKVKQPEEIEAEKKAERRAMAVVGSIVVGFVGFLVWATHMDEKRQTLIREGEAAKDEIRRIAADNEKLKGTQGS